jgi:outer membrane receptor for ferrienterochelin and colicin
MGPSVELKHLLCLALQLAVLFSPGPAVAQSPSDQDLMSLNIEDLARVQVYSASRHQESIREAPSSVTVITAVEIQRYGLAQPRRSSSQRAQLLHLL